MFSQAPGSSAEAAPQMPIPQEVTEGHPAAPVSQKHPGEQGGHGHVVTRAHPGPRRTTHDHCPEQPEPGTATPPGPGALQAPQDIGHSEVQSTSASSVTWVNSPSLYGPLFCIWKQS